MERLKDGTYEIIGCAIRVHQTLGPGLREKPYENALVIALKNAGISPEQQLPYPIRFDGEVVGDCVLDITTRAALVEIKSIDKIGEAERAQMLNYLRVSGHRVGLVINFRNAWLEWETFVR